MEGEPGVSLAQKLPNKLLEALLCVIGRWFPFSETDHLTLAG